MHRRTIRTQLLLLVLMASLPLAGLAVFDALHDFHQLRQVSVDLQLNRADAASGDVQDFIDSSRKILSVLAARPDIRAMDPQGCDPSLALIQSLSDRYMNVGVTRADGLIVCTAMSLTRKIYAEAEGLATLDEAARTRVFVISRAHLGPITRRWVVWLSEPVLDEQGELLGIVTASINLTDFHEIFDHYYWSGQTQFTLLDETGVVLTRSDAPEAWVGMDVSDWADVARLSTGERGWFEGGDLNGRPALFAYTRLRNGWRMIATVDRQAVMRPIWANVLEEAAFKLAALALLVWIGVRLAGWVSQPILDLASVARAVAAGDVSRRAHPAGGREMVEVAEAFNVMLDGRIQAEEALQRHRDGLEALVAERTAHLERALDAAEVAYRAKTVFLATMTHELRSPLNAILGFSGLLLQRLSGPLNEEQTTYLGYIQDGARRLLALISDLLDSSRIEAGAVDVMWEPVDIPAVIDQALNSLRLKAEAKGLMLHAEIDPAVGELLTDRGRLTQILVNLLDNAVKFTDAGEAILQAEIEVGAPGNLCIRISDTGIGIPEDQLEHIFEPFIQVDHGAARRYEGSGLGLSISKRLAELLGGSLEAQSQFGQGSIFTLRLPLDPKVTL